MDILMKLAPKAALPETAGMAKSAGTEKAAGLSGESFADHLARKSAVDTQKSEPENKSAVTRKEKESETSSESLVREEQKPIPTQDSDNSRQTSEAPKAEKKLPEQSDRAAGEDEHGKKFAALIKPVKKDSQKSLPVRNEQAPEQLKQSKQPKLAIDSLETEKSDLIRKESEDFLSSENEAAVQTAVQEKGNIIRSAGERVAEDGRKTAKVSTDKESRPEKVEVVDLRRKAPEMESCKPSENLQQDASDKKEDSRRFGLKQQKSAEAASLNRKEGSAEQFSSVDKNSGNLRVAMPEGSAAPEAGVENGSGINAGIKNVVTQDVNLKMAPGDSASQALGRHLQESLNSDIVKQARFVLKDGNAGEIKLVLRPESLGRIRIQMNLQENHIAGRIIVENSSVREAFENNMSSLQRALRESGYETEGLDVTVDQRDSGHQEAPDDRMQRENRLAALRHRHGSSVLEQSVPRSVVDSAGSLSGSGYSRIDLVI